jgi:dynein heavy chain
LTLVEKEIALLNDVWDLKNDWDKQMEAWKDIKFFDLQSGAMSDIACDYQDKYKAFLSDKEVKEWGVFTHFKNSIDKFRQLIELMGETLLLPAIRDRHWKELRIEVKEDFDEQSEDFTLEKILTLNLLNHINMISELGDNAGKQLKIEQLIVDI